MYGKPSGLQIPALYGVEKFLDVDAAGAICIQTCEQSLESVVRNLGTHFSQSLSHLVRSDLTVSRLVKVGEHCPDYSRSRTERTGWIQEKIIQPVRRLLGHLPGTVTTGIEFFDGGTEHYISICRATYTINGDGDC